MDFGAVHPILYGDLTGCAWRSKTVVGYQGSEGRLLGSEVHNQVQTLTSRGIVEGCEG